MRNTVKMLLLALALLALMQSLLALMQLYRFQRMLVEVQSSFVAVPAQALKRDLERSLALGLPLQDNARIPAMLQQALAGQSLIQSIYIVDAAATPGALLWREGPELSSLARLVRLQKRKPRETWLDEEHPDGYFLSLPLLDPLGGVAATLMVRFDKEPAARLAAEARHDILYYWLALLAAGALPLLGILAWLVRARRLPRAGALLVFLVALTVALAQAWLALRDFEHILTPQLMNKSVVVADSVRGAVQDALELGIPYERLAGMPEYLGDRLAEHREIAAMRVQREGGPDYEARRHAAPGAKETLLPTAVHDNAAGLTIGIDLDAAFLQEKLSVMFGDAAVVLVVALVAGLELALFLVYIWLWRSPADAAHGTQRDMRDARLALFLFVLAEEWLRSFLPLFVRDLADSDARVPLDWQVGAPLLAYMLFAVLGSLFGAGLVVRIGMRRSFIVGVLMSAAALLALAFAQSLEAIVAARVVMALGYAFATMACQNYAAQANEQFGRARGYGVFFAAVTAACVCGAPLGALAAAMFGQPAAFWLAAMLCLLALAAFPRVAGDAAQEERASWLHHYRPLLGNAHILCTLVSAQLAGKLILAGLLFFMLPLLLQEHAVPQAVIGQFFTLYYLGLLLANLAANRFVQADAARRALLFGGTLLGNLAVALLLPLDSLLATGVAIALFGVGQGLAGTPSQARLTAVARAELPQVPVVHVLGLGRAAERVGSAIGTVLAALLAGSVGYHMAGAALGAAGSLLALVALLPQGPYPLLARRPA